MQRKRLLQSILTLSLAAPLLATPALADPLDWRADAPRAAERRDADVGPRWRDRSDAFRVDARREDWRHDGRGRDYHDDRRDDWHGWLPRWVTLTNVRTHSDGRGHDRVYLPRDARAVRLVATHRPTEIIAAYVEYRDGRRERLDGLEGRVGNGYAAETRLRGRCGEGAVLHLVHSSTRDGRRAYFDVLASL